MTYYWYRFADQPALLNADLTKDEREKMQTKVEKLHRAWTKDRDYLAPPTVGKLADLDPAQLVTPPKGLEIGYVPIATRQQQTGTRAGVSGSRHSPASKHVGHAGHGDRVMSLGVGHHRGIGIHGVPVQPRRQIDV